MAEDTVFTLVFLTHGDQVVLARKLKGLGTGCYNGYGGKVKNGESARACAIRELEEETRTEGSRGLIAQETDLVQQAICYFHRRSPDGTEENIGRCDVYTLSRWQGILPARETEEFSYPFWVSRFHLPTWRLMPGTGVWLPGVLAGRKAIVHVVHNYDLSHLMEEVKIKEVSTFLGM